MSHIQQLVDTLTTYQALPHHSDPNLKTCLGKIQTWQKQRIKTANTTLFSDRKTAPLANYLIDRIYGDSDFDILAQQLLTAGHNALNGSGRLEKLIPNNALATGILGIKSAVTAISLDLALSNIMLNNPEMKQEYETSGLNDALMLQAYKLADNKHERLEQLVDLEHVCVQSDKYFNSFIIQKAFPLAKHTAYEHGYQPLYDFIHDGLSAMKHIKRIEEFTKPFVATERQIIDNIHDRGVIFD